MGFHFLLQGVFPTQGSNRISCRQVLYRLSYEGGLPHHQLFICKLALSRFALLLLLLLNHFSGVRLCATP